VIQVTDFMADIVDDIKARVDVVDLVGQYVQLKKAGVNYKACCPFHSEKTASFVVSPEKQIFHCFGCHKGGDIFTFIEEIEGVEFSEALQVLADKAGLKVENLSKFMNKEKKGVKEEYYKAHELACEFFAKQLYKTNDGKKVLEYLYKRGITDDTIKEFKLGFSPDKYDALYPELLKKGITKEVLIKSGIVSAKNLADERIFDKFRGRLIFPIFDYLGRVQGFGGRALKEGQMPKYLNSPENVIYSKSKILYGLYHSKAAIKENGQVILVEGYFDVLLPYQEGVKNVVAVSGTALTEGHTTLIKRLTQNVVSSFDLDSAGFEATKRSYAILKAEGIEMKTMGSFDGKDPADFVLENDGEAFKKMVEEAKDFVAFFMDKLVDANDVSSIDGRRKVIKELLPLLKGVAPSSKDFYVRELSGKLNMKESHLYDELEAFKLPSSHPARKSAEVSSKNDGEGKELFSKLEGLILAVLLKKVNLFSEAVKMIDETYFEEDLKAIYNQLSDQYNSSRTGVEKWNFDKGFSTEARGKVDVLLLYAEEVYGMISEDILKDELQKLVDKLKEKKRSRSLEDLRSRIAEAEKGGDKEKIIELLKEQQNLLTGEFNG